MYRNALEDDFRVRIARLQGTLRDHDRGVVFGFVSSVVPIPPVALMGFVIGLLNLRLLARGALPESERRLIRISLAAALISFVIGTALFAAIGWVVLQALSIKLPAVLSRIEDLANSFWHRPSPLATGRGVQDI